MTTSHGMEYNSQKENLTIAEYGRHVQNLIDHIKTIEDKPKRQEYAEALVSLMGQMNPAQRNDEEYEEKLWRHLFRIADYDLDVIPRSGVVPTPEESEYKPSIIPYPSRQKKNRHYGEHIKKLIAKAVAMEDAEKKEELIVIIASYMKIAYSTWNNQAYVSDDIIKADLEAISDGALKMSADATIDIGKIRTSQNRKNNGRKRTSNNNGRNRKNNNRNNNKGQRRRR